MDTGLLKNFSPIPSNENFSFRFRGEIFNLFNHPQWSDPNATYCAPAAPVLLAAFAQTVGTNGGQRGPDCGIIQLALKMNF